MSCCHLKYQATTRLASASLSLPSVVPPLLQGFVKPTHGQLVVSPDPAELIDKLAAFKGESSSKHACALHSCTQFYVTDMQALQAAAG